MTSSATDAEIMIVGAGLSGLACAYLLAETGRSVLVVEAREEPGGRIRSVFDDTTGHYLADLGPTWVWPAYQPVVRRWIDRLGLELFSQFTNGNAVLDYGPDAAPDVRFLPAQDGNMRLKGGPQALIDQLIAGLPEGTLLTGSPVKSVSVTRQGMDVSVSGDDEKTFRCEHLIVALPPRIAERTIEWRPGLPPSLTAAMSQTPTWMAPHAKVVALFERPFWRDNGLSGRIASQAGPIVEGHDHSSPEGSPAALFGFIGWPHTLRAEAGSHLKVHVRDQLHRCFGPACLEPRSIHVEDWATDRYVTSPRDLAEPMSHPETGPDILRSPHAEGRLWFTGAETATRSPGLIEGALDAAERTAGQLSALGRSSLSDDRSVPASPQVSKSGIR